MTIRGLRDDPPASDPAPPAADQPPRRDFLRLPSDHPALQNPAPDTSLRLPPDHPALATPPRPKSPIVAALLSFWPLPAGLGYLYARHTRRFFAALFLGLIGIPFLAAWLELRRYSGTILLVFLAITAIDSYQLVKHQ